MRMGVALGRRAMRRPAGVADADVAVERLHAELGREIAELALGPAARDGAVLERRDAGAVIAAIFEPPQRIDQARRNRLDADDADDAAHGRLSSFCLLGGLPGQRLAAQLGGVVRLVHLPGPAEGERVRPARPR